MFIMTDITSENALKTQEEKLFFFKLTFLKRFYHKACAYLSTSNSGFNMRKMCYVIAFSVSVK